MSRTHCAQGETTTSEIDNRLSNDSNSEEVKYTTSNFTLHKFSAVISERKFLYQVLKMTGSLLIFVNEKDNMWLSTMFVSLPTRFDTQPIGTRLFGDFMEEASKGIALRISKKLNKAVYVSCNMDENRTLLPLIEKRIFEEIKEKPDMF